MPPVYFDLETDGLPPCNITIACTLSEGKVRDWVSRDGDGKPVPMTPEIAEELATYLHSTTDGGTELVTFNGAKFDLKLLHELVASDETKSLVAELVQSHNSKFQNMLVEQMSLQDTIKAFNPFP